jgi:protein tyrosine phosphatase (PTP) superfamily phosphohydrolase (DUF442 family)
MRLKSVEDIRNFIALTPQIGTAGQPLANQFKLISDAGYETVINIAMPDHPDSIDHEGRIVTELSMNYIHLPVPFAAPTADHVNQFFHLLKAQQGRKVFVHCIMNYRVSAFMFLYLTLFQGYPSDQARSPIFDSWEIEPEWQKIMNLDAASPGLTVI